MNPIPADVLMKTISYYYLVNYCPPSQVSQLKKMARTFRKEVAAEAGMSVPDYFKATLPEVCSRIVAFHQATREPDSGAVEALLKVGKKADSSEKGAANFQAVMGEIAALPGRSKLNNRLHRQKGCRFCAAPCKYGYFTLVSDPIFVNLLAMLNAENSKPAGERNPVNVLWTYTTTHLWRVLGKKEGIIRADHLGDLSYCLLMLATARSRYALPEAQLQTFQAMNQDVIRNWRPVQINMMKVPDRV